MDFQLRLLSQNWVDDDPANSFDLCTHGGIYLKIGGYEVSNEKDGEWTVSTSALMMLRSAMADYATSDTSPMINHCGQLAMIGCPISISWTVRHDEDSVVISELQKQPTTNTKDVVCYLEGKEFITVDRVTYIRDILRFSDAIAQFLENSLNRRFEEEHDRTEYGAFLDEFNCLRNKARTMLKTT